MYNVKSKKEVWYSLNKSCLCRNCRGEKYKNNCDCNCMFDENSIDLCGYAFKFDERKHFAIKK